MAVGRFFFSAVLPAQNSPELHFRFINSFYPIVSAKVSGADLYCNWLTDVKYLVLGIFICGNFAWILLYGHLSRDAILRIRQHFTTFSIASIIMHVFFMSHDKVIKCINSRTYFRLVSIIDINHFLVQFFLLIQLHPKAYAQEYQYFLI